MTTKSIIQLFDQYQKARLNFIKQISEIALRYNNIPILDENNILGKRTFTTFFSLINCIFLELLTPLLSDVCKQIQNCATIALGRIIQNDHVMAKKFTQTNLISILLTSLPKENVCIFIYDFCVKY